MLDHIIAQLKAEKEINRSLRTECQVAQKNEAQIRENIERLKQTNLLLLPVIRDLKKQLALEYIHIHNSKKEQDHVINRFHNMIDICISGACNLIRMNVRNDQQKIKMLRKELVQYKERVRKNALDRISEKKLMNIIENANTKVKQLKENKRFLLKEIEKEQNKIALLVEEKSKLALLGKPDISMLRPQCYVDLRVDRWVVAKEICHPDIIIEKSKCHKVQSHLPILKAQPPKKPIVLLKPGSIWMQNIKPLQPLQWGSQKTVHVGSKIPLLVRHSSSDVSSVKSNIKVKLDGILEMNRINASKSQNTKNGLINKTKSNEVLDCGLINDNNNNNVGSLSSISMSSSQFSSLEDTNANCAGFSSGSGYNVILEMNSNNSAIKNKNESSPIRNGTHDVAKQLNYNKSWQQTFAKEFPLMVKFCDEFDSIHSNSFQEKSNSQDDNLASQLTVCCKPISRMFSQKDFSKDSNVIGKLPYGNTDVIRKVGLYDSQPCKSLEQPLETAEQEKLMRNEAHVKDEHGVGNNSKDKNDAKKPKIHDLSLNDILGIDSEDSQMNSSLMCCQSGYLEKMKDYFGICSKTYSISHDFSVTIPEGKWRRSEDELSFDLSYFTNWNNLSPNFDSSTPRSTGSSSERFSVSFNNKNHESFMFKLK